MTVSLYPYSFRYTGYPVPFLLSFVSRNCKKLLDGVVQFLGDAKAFAFLGGGDLLGHFAEFFDLARGEDEEGGFLGNKFDDVEIAVIENFFVPTFAEGQQAEGLTAGDEGGDDFDGPRSGEGA